MPKTCFVPYCPSRSRCSNRSGVRFFAPPKDEIEFQKWRQLIRCKDKPLNSRSYICQEHFEENSITKYFEHIINGEHIRIPRRWVLKPGAVPSIFPQFPVYLPKRKLPEVAPVPSQKKNLRRKSSRKPNKGGKGVRAPAPKECLVRPKPKHKSKNQRSTNTKPRKNKRRKCKPTIVVDPARAPDRLSPPRPSTTIFIKSEPLSDYECCDNDNIKKPRLDVNLNTDVKKEDLSSVAIKVEFDPDQIVIKEEFQSEEEYENVINYEDDNSNSNEHLASYEFYSRSDSLISYENECSDSENKSETRVKIRNEKLESVTISSSVSISEFSGFSFGPSEQQQPYVVDSPMQTNKVSKRVQTDMTSAFQHDQLITFHQLTEDKLFVFTGVTKHKFMILFNFLFCNTPSFILKCLSDEDQLLLVLFRFKHNPPKEYLSHLFGITEKQVSHIMRYITSKFRKGLNDVTMWSLKEGKCSLAAIMECRDFISNNLKRYCPNIEISQFL